MVMDSDKSGGAGRLVVVGSIAGVCIALIGGIYSVGQNAASVESEVRSLSAQMHTALRNGETKLERVEAHISALLDRNCRILTQLDQDIRVHGLADPNNDNFPPFPEVSC